MTLESTVEQLISAVATQYGGMLQRFRPCKPGSEFLEQNLVTLLIREFLNKFGDDGIAYTELPFQSAQDLWDLRMDAFLANADSAYLVEAKGLGENANNLQWIESDLARIESCHLRESIHTMATAPGRRYTIPARVFGIIIADCWHRDVANQWSDNHLLQQRFPRISRLSTRSIKVGSFGKYEYFILAGQTPYLDWERGVHQPLISEIETQV